MMSRKGDKRGDYNWNEAYQFDIIFPQPLTRLGLFDRHAQHVPDYGCDAVQDDDIMFLLPVVNSPGGIQVGAKRGDD